MEIHLDLQNLRDGGPTPLMNAILHHNNDRSLELIDSGADVNATDIKEGTALVWAVQMENEPIIKALLQAGANVNARVKEWQEKVLIRVEEHDFVEENLFYGSPALILAIEKNNVEIVKLLIENGADVNIKDDHGSPALISAIKNNNVEMVKQLIENCADINIKDNLGRPALISAIEKDNVEIVKLLVENDADVNIEDDDGLPALISAIKNDNVEIVKMLFEKGTDVIIKGDLARSVLISAITNNNVEMVKLLIEKGADVNEKDNYGQTSICYAAKHGNASMVRFLIDAGADVHVRDIYQENVLFNAVKYNSIEVIEMLLDHGKADLSIRNIFGRTPLFYAVASKVAIQTARLLHAKGAKLNDTDSCNFSVLSFYIEHKCDEYSFDNELEIFDLFTEKGIQMGNIFFSTINILYSKLPRLVHRNSHMTQRFASNCFNIASKYAHNNEQKRMIEILRSYNVLTSEHQADKLPESLDILIQLGANPNSVDSNGNTSLHYAVQLSVFGVSKGFAIKFMEQVEKHGARLDIKNHEKQTPLLFCLSAFDREFQRVEHLYCAKDKKQWPEFKKVKEICRNFLNRNNLILNETQGNGKSVFHLMIKLFHKVLALDNSILRENNLQEMVELLKLFCIPDIIQGVTVNKLDDKLESPLHLWASLTLASNDDYSNVISGELTFENLLKSIFTILLDCGAKLNARDTKDQTPLHHCGTWSAFKCLAEAGAKQNDHDSSGRPPLLAAAHNKVFMKDPGHFFPDVTDDPKSFFTTCVELDLDLWACDNDGESVLNLLLESETFVLAKAFIEATCEFKPSVLEQLLTVICKDKSTHTFWKIPLVENILSCMRKRRLQMDLSHALRCCCLHINRICENHGYVLLEKEEKDEEPPTKKLRIDDSDGRREDCLQPLPSTVHLDIARQLLLHGANGTALCEEFPQLHTLLTEEIDYDLVPVTIPWTSYSKKHEARLARVARRQNVYTIGTYWYNKEPIGSGSFGHVFAGINEKDGREIAIKKIEKLRMVRPEDKREIINLTALADCQQVVTYICFDDSDTNFVYIVLELMEGHLDEYFASPSFDPRHNSSLCKDVIMGLKYLHNHKPDRILHRDLKPGNILYKVHPNLCLKIADFGLSSPMTTTGTTVRGTNVGTRRWIAPEVIRSNTYQHSMASDNYSCGLLLHYILSSNKHPFSPANFSKKTQEIIDLETQNNMLNNKMEGWDYKLSPEATHLIKGLLSSNVAVRRSAADSISHPMFWSNKKKIAFLTAVGNQPEIECPRPASGPLGAVESDLEAEFSRIVQHSTWVDAKFKYMPCIYTEMTKPIVKGKGPPRKPRLYKTGSVIELIRFIRNSIAHVSDAHRTIYVRKQILEDAVFLVEFPHLVIELFKVVTKHGWDTREEIKHAMSSE